MVSSIGDVFLNFQICCGAYRRQNEAEIALIEEETARRIEEAIRVRVEEELNSPLVKAVIAAKISEGRQRIAEEVKAQLVAEKEALLTEARCAEEEDQRKQEELNAMLEENQRIVEEAQRKEAEAREQEEEHRFRELEAQQKLKEEAMRKKRLEEEQVKLDQMKVLGKKNARPKLSFSLGK